MGIFSFSRFLSPSFESENRTTFLSHIFIEEKFVFSLKANNQNKCNNRLTTSHDARNRPEGERYKFHGKTFERNSLNPLRFSVKLRFHLIVRKRIELCNTFKTLTRPPGVFAPPSIPTVSIISICLNSWIAIPIYLVNTICHGAKGA